MHPLVSSTWGIWWGWTNRNLGLGVNRLKIWNPPITYRWRFLSGKIIEQMGDFPTSHFWWHQRVVGFPSTMIENVPRVCDFWSQISQVPSHAAAGVRKISLVLWNRCNLRSYFGWQSPLTSIPGMPPISGHVDGKSYFSDGEWAWLIAGPGKAPDIPIDCFDGLYPWDIPTKMLSNNSENDYQSVDGYPGTLWQTQFFDPSCPQELSPWCALVVSSLERHWSVYNGGLQRWWGSPWGMGILWWSAIGFSQQ